MIVEAVLNLVSNLRPGQMGSLVTDALFWLGRIFYVLGFSPVESEHRRSKRVPQAEKALEGSMTTEVHLQRGKPEYLDA